MDNFGIEYGSDSIAFSRNEWKYFLDEIKMRGVDKVRQCVNNARYLAKLDRADEQIRKGEVVALTSDELEAILNGDTVFK